MIDQTNWAEQRVRDFEKSQAAKLLPLANIGAFAERSPPERSWLVDGLIPMRQATYLTGKGATGKSLLGQILATTTAMGRPFLGIATLDCNALYVTCEDDLSELERRHAAICNGLGINRDAPAERLFLSSLTGRIDNELIAFDGEGKATPSNAYTRLVDTAIMTKARLIVLDNVAHLTPDEIARNKVAAFVNLLNRLAMAIDGAVLLIGHPNKSGDPYSGSTAWENQVRSRLYLETPTQPDGTFIDADGRTLTVHKANYARNGQTLQFRWHCGTFILDSDLPRDQRAQLDETLQASAENAAFMDCLRQRASEGVERGVGPSPGPNYAPSQFEGCPQAKGFRRDALKRAMDRLFGLGLIETRQVERPGKSAMKTIIVECAERFPELPERLPEPLPNTVPERSLSTPELPRILTPYTTYMGGQAPLGGPAPLSNVDSDDDIDPGDPINEILNG